MRDFPREAWRDLGRWLMDRRVELNPRWRHRRQFVEDPDHDTSMRRVIQDIETGQRTNFKPETLRQVEVMYQLAPGSIELILAGGEPVKLEDLERRDVTSEEGAGEGVQTTLTVLSDELDALPADEREQAVRAVEAAGLAIIRELRRGGSVDRDY